MNKVDVVEQARLRTDIPAFRPGDQVRVHVKVREANRERIQIFEGVVIARRGGGLRESFTVRKVSFGVGVERTFPLHAPVVAKIEVARHGRVRRAKLYYLRALSGRHAKIAERRTRIPAETVEIPEEEATFEPELAPEGEQAESAEAATETPEAATEAPAEPVAEAPAKPVGEADLTPAPEQGDVAEQAPAEPEPPTEGESPRAEG